LYSFCNLRPINLCQNRPVTEPTENVESLLDTLADQSDPRLLESEYARLMGILLEMDERNDFSPEEEALAEVLTLLLGDYKENRHPLPSVSPNESLKALMEERGLKHKDIWPVLGNKGAATEVLSGRRSISKAQAKRLAEFFRVPIDLFILTASAPLAVKALPALASGRPGRRGPPHRQNLAPSQPHTLK
jgi:HTH-type transcriptional regulator / antitoxin HigA